MAITEHDLELFAAPIRPQFPAELREIAYELALSIARVAGPKVKLLTPDTSIDTILEWSGATFLVWSVPAFEDGADLDKVEQTIALEEEFGGGFAVPDALMSRADKATFREWVEHVASKRRVS